MPRTVSKPISTVYPTYALNSDSQTALDGHDDHQSPPCNMAHFDP